MGALLRRFTKGQRIILALTVTYTVGFYAYYILRGNREFVLYLVEFFGFIIIACALLARERNFPTPLLALLSLVGLMHVAGGGLSVGEVRLYDLHLIPLYDGGASDIFALKYDQLVHLLGFGAMAFVARWLILDRAPGFPPSAASLLAALAAMGLGALNEVSEFSAVVAFSRTGVGGYYNIVLDLTFNLIGAVGAVLLVEVYERFRKRKE